MMKWVAFLGGTGVAMGAFGAHGLRDKVTTRELEIFQTATHYQLVHAVALLALVLAAPKINTKLTQILWIVGTLIFSGTLYLLVFTGQKWLGAITPLGGLSYILGWFNLARCSWRSSPSS